MNRSKSTFSMNDFDSKSSFENSLYTTRAFATQRVQLGLKVPFNLRLREQVTRGQFLCTLL